MKPEDMPAPGAAVEYDDGEFSPAMFHYAIEGADTRAIAREHGFDCRFLMMEDDSRDEVEPLRQRYGGGDDTALAEWTPPDAEEGWTLAGKWQSEDGPVALWLRPRVAA